MYKRQVENSEVQNFISQDRRRDGSLFWTSANARIVKNAGCLLYTSDAVDERSSVDLGGRRIIKKKNIYNIRGDAAPNK